MSVISAAANRIVNLSCVGSLAGFSSGAKNLADVQNRILSGYLKRNARTVFGREYGFSTIRDYREYRARVPVSTYTDYQKYIDRLMRGENSVLTADPVRLLEPTSGTTQGSKLIPYTKGLSREYLRAVQPWLADLYKSDPQLLNGPAYWSISPAISLQESSGSAIPVGFEDDAGYFGLLAPVLRHIYPVPSSVRQLESIENFRFMTMLMLLNCSDLRLFSVWNPSFLTILMEYAFEHQSELLASLSDGLARWPVPATGIQTMGIAKNPARARVVEQAFGQECWTRSVWPELRLISAWTAGHSAFAADRLRRFFPEVRLQGKGLLATEGVVSFPLEAAGGSVLAYRSHFFEFVCADGAVLQAAELEKGLIASVLLTTGGGLYRYELGDRVRVTEMYRGLPVLEFLGRNRTSDLAGEKLAEDFVASALRGLDLSAPPEIILLAPVISTSGCGYQLCIEVSGLRATDADAIAARLEELLAANIHYAYARRLGQLRPVLVRLLPANSVRRFFDFMETQGYRAGNIKIPALYTRTDIEDCFAPGEDQCTSRS